MFFSDANLLVSFPLEDKHVVNEHYVIQKNYDATQERCHRMVHFNVPRDWFEQTCSIKKVTLKVAKKICECRGLLGRVIRYL